MSLLRQKSVKQVLGMLLLGLLTLIAAACSIVNAASSPQGGSTTGGESAQLHTTLAGVATLKWDPKTHDLTVLVTLSGLAANSRHPDHIHLGSCATQGAIQYGLTDLVANRNGEASSNTVIHQVMNGIPANGRYIKVHQGPTLADAFQATPIACGNITNADTTPWHGQEATVKISSIFLNQFAGVNKVASTVPADGDVNPYGVAVVKNSIGRLTKGNVLVSNFNNGANLQGLGSSIVQISPDGKQSLFAQLPASACPDGIGLTTALVELKRGWVIVGSLPAADGQFANVKAGCLIVLDSNGKVVKTFTSPLINGPWDATVLDDGDHASLFVTNTLNDVVPANTTIVNKGTVVRFTLDVPEAGKGVPSIKSATVIGTGFAEKTDQAALVIGPTGVGLGQNGTLYVADTLNSRISAIPDALTREHPVSANDHVLSANGALNTELGLTIAPNGDIITVNGNDGNAVEITPDGVQIAVKQFSDMGAGCLFGLAIAPDGHGVYFVDDCTNQLNLFR